MKINRKPAEKNSICRAHKEVEATVTSFFEVEKDLQIDLITVVRWLKNA